MTRGKLAAIMIITILILTLGATAAANSDQQSTKAPKQLTIEQKLKAHANASKMERVLDQLITRAGRTRYVYSGSTTKGWDCSGLVVWTYKRFGITLPHSADKQGRIGKRTSTPQPGDIVVFAYKGRTDFYHSAIYLGDGKIINANSAYGTTIIQRLTEYPNAQIRYVQILTRTEQ